MNDDLREVATELLRLYDWRFKLAKEEEWIKLHGHLETEVLPHRVVPSRSAMLRYDLLRYGHENKVAWERLRAILTDDGRGG